MKAYIITVKGNELSEQSAKKTFDSAKWAGLEPELFYGVNKLVQIGTYMKRMV